MNEMIGRNGLTGMNEMRGSPGLQSGEQRLQALRKVPALKSALAVVAERDCETLCCPVAIPFTSCAQA